MADRYELVFEASGFVTTEPPEPTAAPEPTPEPEESKR